jgi:urea transporter
MSPIPMDPETSNDGLPRFSPVAFNDHAGQLWIVTILSLIYSSLVATARAYIKHQMFGFDDILIALAMVRKLISPGWHSVSKLMK